jgi:hypothetical protein
VCNEIEADEVELEERMIAADLARDVTSFERAQAQLQGGDHAGPRGTSPLESTFTCMQRARDGATTCRGVLPCILQDAPPTQTADRQMPRRLSVAAKPAPEPPAELVRAESFP